MSNLTTIGVIGSVLGESLARNGFKRIWIADDKPENLAAARLLAKTMPEVRFTFFSSEDAVMGALLESEIVEQRPAEVDLVLTDLCMENKESGEWVYSAFASRGIPAVVITDYEHHGEKIDLYSPITRIEVQGLEGSKEDVSTWEKAFGYFTEKAKMPYCNWRKENIDSTKNKEGDLSASKKIVDFGIIEKAAIHYRVTYGPLFF